MHSSWRSPLIRHNSWGSEEERTTSVLDLFVMPHTGRGEASPTRFRPSSFPVLETTILLTQTVDMRLALRKLEAQTICLP